VPVDEPLCVPAVDAVAADGADSPAGGGAVAAPEDWDCLPPDVRALRPLGGGISLTSPKSESSAGGSGIAFVVIGNSPRAAPPSPWRRGAGDAGRGGHQCDGGRR